MMIQGWMTKVSIILGLIGSACLAGAQVAPDPSWVPWLNFAGVVLGSIGGAGAGVGIARKIERGPVDPTGTPTSTPCK
jgi:hypothetical protein